MLLASSLPTGCTAMRQRPSCAFLCLALSHAAVPPAQANSCPRHAIFRASCLARGERSDRARSQPAQTCILFGDPQLATRADAVMQASERPPARVLHAGSERDLDREDQQASSDCEVATAWALPAELPASLLLARASLVPAPLPSGWRRDEGMNELFTFCSEKINEKSNMCDTLSGWDTLVCALPTRLGSTSSY